MLIVTYDFTNDKVRSQFSKFLKRYGRKIQYSVYEIRNSPRVLQNILNEIELRYKAKFGNTDGILIFSVCERCEKKIVRYGHHAQEEREVVFF